jgi:hypothetical protein
MQQEHTTIAATGNIAMHVSIVSTDITHSGLTTADVLFE